MSGVPTPEWDSIHHLLADIATAVGTPALVEDTQHVVLAYSPHADPGDVVRQSTIMGRRASAAVVRWLRELGIAEATAAVRVPANEQLGMQPRVCLPLRRAGHLVGYLWFIDPDMDMSAFDLELAWRSADDIIDQLMSSGDLPMLAPVGVVTSALRGEHGDSHSLELLFDTRLDHAGTYQVMVVRPPQDHPSAADLRRVVCSIVRLLERQAAFGAVVDDFGVVIYVSWAGAPGGAAAARRARAEHGSSVVVGIGDPVSDFASMLTSYETAQHAALSGSLWPHSGPVVEWQTAGMHRLVPAVSHEDGAVGALVGRLADMLRDPDQEYLALTAEVYLDCAAHAQGTASALVLHRTTMYQRLQRFSKLTGLDLRRGDDRALAHLALKAARMVAEIPMPSLKRH